MAYVTLMVQRNSRVKCLNFFVGLLYLLRREENTIMLCNTLLKSIQARRPFGTPR